MEMPNLTHRVFISTYRHIYDAEGFGPRFYVTKDKHLYVRAQRTDEEQQLDPSYQLFSLVVSVTPEQKVSSGLSNNVPVNW